MSLSDVEDSVGEGGGESTSGMCLLSPGSLREDVNT
jgi:hypothetical protein